MLNCNRRGAEGPTDLSPRPAAAAVAVRNVNFVYEQTNILVLYKHIYSVFSVFTVFSLVFQFNYIEKVFRYMHNVHVFLSLAVANCSPMTYRNLPLGCNTCEASVPCRRVREKYFPSSRKQYDIPTTTIAKKPHMNSVFISLRPAQLLAL